MAPKDLNTAPSDAAHELSPALVAVLAVATGALVANLYYAQPLIGMIAPQIGISPATAGSIVGVTQIGYGVGLFLIVSLADIIENKRLVLMTLGGLLAGLILLALARNGPMFLAGSLVVGVCSTGVQVLVPFATHLTPEAKRGRVVGEIMGGVLTGIMLARPIALFIAASFGWRAVFGASAVVTVVIGLVLLAAMPAHAPRGQGRYVEILRSMFSLMRREPALRRRAAYQGLMFAAFNLFWTAAPIMLAHRFGLSQRSIALFALAGAGGALSAPLAGRLADRGLVRAATLGAMIVLTAGFYATRWPVAAGALAALVVLTVLIDAAVQVNQVAGQRVIFSLSPEARGRINAIYMTCVFIGGAIGSTASTAIQRAGGWDRVADVGAAAGAVMLALFALAEHRDRRHSRGSDQAPPP